MGARRFFIGARGMCRLLGTSAGRSGTRAVALGWSRLMGPGGAAIAQEEGPCAHDHLLYYLGRHKSYTIG
ncbi:hypothetical protein BHE74_00046265 [Ensete ventricosum]|nr:hypothetical protein BHE74_00046265 [Ensete ventricosum]